jgi:hypothetical protein
MLGYVIYDATSHTFLDGDERSWTPKFYDAAVFTDANHAADVRCFQALSVERVTYVMEIQ